VNIVPKATKEMIYIAKGWQHYKGSKEPRGGWLGRGFFKIAIQAIFRRKLYAIMQMQSLRNFAATPEENKKSLMNEHKLLGLAQYFVELFYERTSAYGIDISAEALVGELVCLDNLPAVPLDPQKPDDHTLIHPAFLATQLINKADGYTEVKFSDSMQLGKNTSSVGRAVNVFAHHVLVDSEGTCSTCILVDLQG
ncbi:hypothetical protein BV20DRAFT_959201, partial [Pilatotrama ljubarskyi]